MTLDVDDDYFPGCYCEYGGGDPPEFTTTVMRTARKPHTCCECQDTIHPGERYEYTSGRWCDHGMRSFHTCGYCARLRTVIEAKVGDSIPFASLGCAMLDYMDIEP